MFKLKTTYCSVPVATNIFLRLVMKVLNVTLSRLLWITVSVIIIFLLLWYPAESIEYTVKESLDYPLILWWSSNFPGTSETRACDNLKCEIYSNRSLGAKFNVSAYLFYGSDINIDELPLPRTKDVLWGLFHEESPRNVEELMHEDMIRLFNFTSTFSRYSNIPFPLQYLESKSDILSLEYFVPTKEKNKLLEEIAPVLYLQSDCETSTERDAYVEELMKYITIDSYGACLNNKLLPQSLKNDYLNKLDDHEFLKFIARYKFVIAIENGVCEDYITEKLWRAIKVGTVPIYFGSPSIKDWLPNEKSAILLQDYITPELLKDHMYKLLENDSMYEEYLEHKSQQVIHNQKLNNELVSRPYQVGDRLKTVVKFECFICKQLHDELKGSKEINIATKSHYSCPKPVSALTLDVNPRNSWISSWESAKVDVEKLYQRIKN